MLGSSKDQREFSLSLQYNSTFGMSISDPLQFWSSVLVTVSEIESWEYGLPLLIKSKLLFEMIDGSHFGNH